MGRSSYNPQSQHRGSSVRRAPVTSESTVNCGFFGGSIRWQLNADPDDQHEILFVHRGLTGSRTIVIDGTVMKSTKMEVKLVGCEKFSFGRADKRHRGIITVKPVGWFHYQYTLYIDGLAYRDFLQECQSQTRRNTLNDANRYLASLKRQRRQQAADAARYMTAEDLGRDSSQDDNFTRRISDAPTGHDSARAWATEA